MGLAVRRRGSDPHRPFGRAQRRGILRIGRPDGSVRGIKWRLAFSPGEERPTVHVLRIEAPDPCGDPCCIRFLLLSNGQKIPPEEANAWLLAGAVLRCGSESGPGLEPPRRGDRRSVRARPFDSPSDPVLGLPRSL